MIKNISTMTREELILALEKETALKHEAGKKLAEAQSSLLKKDIENKKLESIIIKKDELIIKQAELLKLYNIDKYMTQRSILSDDSSEQLSLFSLSAEDEPDEVKAEEDEAAAHKRIKAKKEKHIDYSNLPHKEIIHKADDVKCDNCGEEMVVYKYETKEVCGIAINMSCLPVFYLLLLVHTSLFHLQLLFLYLTGPDASYHIMDLCISSSESSS